MPGWLQPVAELNPVTVMVDAVRSLFIGTPAGNAVWGSVVWCLVILAIFAPLSAWRYRRAVTR
jgi:ABC-type multidrug transport system permease subunit